MNFIIDELISAARRGLKVSRKVSRSVSFFLSLKVSRLVSLTVQKKKVNLLLSVLCPVASIPRRRWGSSKRVLPHATAVVSSLPSTANKLI